MEIWKDIKGYEGLYQVSNLGNVKRKGKKKNLKFTINNSGYKRVCLSKNGKVQTRYIHRLVAIAFIPNLTKEKEINHKDENKLNNNVENLEWCNHKYNLNYGECQSRKSNSNKKAIIQYDRNNVVIKEFSSIEEAKRELNIKGSNISKCCKNEIKTYKGYIWRYKKGA